MWYTKGIEDLTNNIEETIEYLKNITSGYESVIFIGASMGGYAAILYGSILNVNHVIGFRPQTIIRDEDNIEIDPLFNDLCPVINSTTEYHLYGDSNILDESDIHNIHHCRRISKNNNVKVYEYFDFDIKEYKNSGKLKDDFKSILFHL